MHSFGIRVFERREKTLRQSGQKLRAVTAIMLTLATGVPSGFAQQTAPTVNDNAASALPAAPAPVLTEPFNLRQSMRDFSVPGGRFAGNPINWYRPTTVDKANFANSVRLGDMLKDGKIYLSLSDAIALAIENNYDIAIARYNLDIADSDILRAKSGSGLLLGVPTGLVTGTLGGASQALTTGGGPGGTTVGAGGSAAGGAGLSLSTNGAGPTPESLDPTVGATIQFERTKQPQTSAFAPSSTSTTNQYNFTYNQGFTPGAALTIAFNNSRVNTSNPFSTYTPEYSSNFRATVTQHLLQGAGIWVNKRLIYQAMNDRRIANSGFRQQILYTVNQVENIYWGLVQAYEDTQAKERALQQSSQLLEDDKKQLQIGTMAPLDVVNAQSQVATDTQALVSSQNTLNYQQQIIKQAIARNLNDPALERAPVIPTDRVSLEELPEEQQSVEDLAQEAFRQRPELEQAVLTLKNDEITLKGAKNGMLPVFDVYGFYQGTGVGGIFNTNCGFGNIKCPTVPSIGVGDVLHNMVNSTAPDKGIGFNLQIPIRNRLAQSVQERSEIEYRQAELRLAQLYTEIRMQVVNAQFAITNERALVKADLAAEQYARESYNDEVKKLHLGASTTSNVLTQERALALAEDNLIAAQAGYANARASLYQMLASTLKHYGINLQDAATGAVNSAPTIKGLQPAEKGNEPTTKPPAIPTGSR